MIWYLNIIIAQGAEGVPIYYIANFYIKSKSKYSKINKIGIRYIFSRHTTSLIIVNIRRQIGYKNLFRDPLNPSITEFGKKYNNLSKFFIILLII